MKVKLRLGWECVMIGLQKMTLFAWTSGWVKLRCDLMKAEKCSTKYTAVDRNLASKILGMNFPEMGA
jgi:hypothetical protein